MKRIVIAVVMSVGTLSLAAISSADTLVMRDGRRVEGTVVGIMSRTITFRHADGVTRRYTTSEVEALEFSSAERANPRAVNGRRIDAPAGTELVVRTVELIDSRKRGADQNFSAIVEEGVVRAGLMIIPKGSSVQLVIRQVSSGGTAGIAEMALDVHSVTIDGRRYLVSAHDKTIEPGSGVSRNDRTAEPAGAGGLVGTIVNLIAGGEGPQVVTSGRGVHVPAETALTFRLDKAVALQAEP